MINRAAEDFTLRRPEVFAANYEPAERRRGAGGPSIGVPGAKGRGAKVLLSRMTGQSMCWSLLAYLLLSAAAVASLGTLRGTDFASALNGRWRSNSTLPLFDIELPHVDGLGTRLPFHQRLPLDRVRSRHAPRRRCHP